MNTASRDEAPEPAARSLRLVAAPADGPALLARVTVTPNEAAEMLGVSRDFFDEHVKPALRIIRPGRKIILIPVAELSRWAETSAARWTE
jgi:excisionase family DNA binding protein